MSADAATVIAFLRRISRRQLWLAAINGAAVALTVSAVLIAAQQRNPLLIALTVIAVVVVWTARLAAAVLRGNVGAAALEVERRSTLCRNIIITAVELAQPKKKSTVQSYVSGVVFADAARVVGQLQPSALFPAQRPVLRVGLAALAAAAALLVTTTSVYSGASVVTDGDAASIERIDVVVTPPGYTSRSSQTLRDPSRIEAIAGSRISLSVRARASSVSVETLSGERPAEAARPGVFVIDIPADADGFIAVEPGATSGRAGVRRLIGLSVTPDASPRVRITAPGRDMLVPDATRTVDVAIDATDDFGLASLTLRYTKVSGSGENFTFTEGEVPVVIARDSGGAWHAKGSIGLATSGLSQGDMLVYRGVATDSRPGAPPAESETYIIEIAAPGAEAAAGFAIDDERDRYGLSQQMVIVKTERLIARRASMPRDSVAREAMAIAAEQRAVRAEFVFMMGGEIAEDVIAAAGLTDLNETAEAEAEGDVLAGRLANRGRIELVRAIRSMSRAATGLTATDLDKALADEKAALVYLQGAFARARYILRALTERERLDLSRRLSGSLAGVLRDVRPVAKGTPEAGTVALRAALADVASLSGADELGRDESARAARLAQSILQIDPASPPLQEVAATLASASRAIDERDLAGGRNELARAATRLSAAIRTQFPEAPPHRSPLELDRLRGALTDELRSSGPSR
jgi:hypothetical protein